MRAAANSSTESCDVPVPDSHKHILDERLNTYRANREGSRSWSEVRDELLAKLRDG